MKKIKSILLFVMVVVVFSSCKKDEVEEQIINNADNYKVVVDGVELSDNAEKIYHAIGDAGNMELSIKNISSESINLKMKVVSITGNYSGVGGSMNFCIGSCYTFVEEGKSYPINEIYTLGAGQTSQQGAVHVQNLDDRSGDLTFKIKLFQVDGSGNELTSKKSITFTYKYVTP